MESKTYNKKGFLLPDSQNSMASYHAKIQSDGIYKLTIHDCRGSIQLWGDLNVKEQRIEASVKLLRLASAIMQLHGQILEMNPVNCEARAN